jgi:hypothetical protein
MDAITGQPLLTRNMIERNVAKLLEARGELCVRDDSREENAEKEETNGANGFHAQSRGTDRKAKNHFRQPD